MSAANFPACLKHVLQWEGGYVDHPADPGGATNKGITRGTLSDWLGRPASKSEVRNITRPTVAAIYRARYWNRVRGDDLPDGLDLVAFDGGVNSGPLRGAKWLQGALGVKADGHIGPKTISAASRADGVRVIQKACAARMGFLQRLRTWKTFGRGWSRRVAATEAQAVAMYTRSASRVEVGAESIAKRAAATGAAGGAGASGAVLAMPDSVWLFAAVGVVVLLLILRALHDKRRAAAYQAAAEAMGHE